MHYVHAKLYCIGSKKCSVNTQNCIVLYWQLNAVFTYNEFSQNNVRSAALNTWVEAILEGSLSQEEKKCSQVIYMKTTKKYSVEKDKFGSYFVKLRNMIIEWVKFNSHKNLQDDMVDNFITDLFCLAEHWAYRRTVMRENYQGQAICQTPQCNPTRKDTARCEADIRECTHNTTSNWSHSSTTASG